MRLLESEPNRAKHIWSLMFFATFLIFGSSLMSITYAEATSSEAGEVSHQSLSIVINGKTYSENDAQDMGTFSNEHVSQNAKMVRDEYWTIWFRRDTDGTRPEIVVEYGLAQNKNKNPQGVPGYTAEISEDGSKIASVDVPWQPWGTRWRWQKEGRRPLVKTIDEVKSSPLLPQVKLSTSHHKPAKAEKYSIMGRSSLIRQMSATGERDEIGVITAWTAHALITGDVKGIFETAEAGATIEGHLRTEDGRILDISGPRIFPNALNKDITFHGNQFARSYYVPKGKDPTIFRDTAHHPSLFVLPYLLTGDPFYLEELHYTVMNHMTWTNYDRNYNRTGRSNMLISFNQVRSSAWVLRDVLHAYELTPDDAPSWLLPRSYFDKSLKDFAEEFTNRTVNNQSHGMKTFQMFSTDRNWLAPWQTDFVIAVMGLVILNGHDDFRPAYEHLLKSAIARTDGKSGYDRRFAAGLGWDYYFRNTGSLNTWKQLSDAYLQSKQTSPSPDNPSQKDIAWNQMGYADYTFGALAIANQLGYDVKDSLTWLNKARERKKKGKRIYSKWSFDPGDTSEKDKNQ